MVFQLLITRMPKPENNLKLEWTSNTIMPNSEVTLELVWSPIAAISAIDVLQITDSFGSTKDVSIVLKSVNNNVKKKASVKVTKPVYKMRSPTYKHIPRKSNVLPLQQNNKILKESNYLKNSPSSNEKLNATNIFKTANSPNVDKLFSRARRLSTESKENLTPMTPPDASILFNNLNFTPATAERNRNNEYLADRPTPKIRDQNISNIFNNIQFTPITDSNAHIDYLSDLPTPGNNQSHSQRRRRVLETEFPYTPVQDRYHRTDTSLSNMPTPIQQIIITTPDNMVARSIDFNTINRTKSACNSSENSCNEIEIILTEENISPAVVNNQTQTISSASPLSAISEHDEQSRLFKTFKITFSPQEAQIETHNNTVTVTSTKVTSESMVDFNGDINISYEKKENMKLNQGSMPDLNNIHLSGTSINHNRFYYERQNEDGILFKPNEIRAESSRFNIHEAGKVGEFVPKSPSVKYVSPQTSRTPRTPRTPKTPNLQRRSPAPSPGFSTSAAGKYHQLNVQSIQIMSISPPKRRRIVVSLENNDLEKMCDTRRSPRHSQKKNMKIKPLVLKRPPIPMPTPRKMKQSFLDKSTSSNYPQIYKLNPFAATSLDPFLTSTMCLDDNAISVYEEQFKKWLNALVTIPADLESETSEKIDLGKLFNDLKNKKLILAPTKELTSSKYFCKNRINSLREAANKLYYRTDMINILNKVNKQIDDKLLMQKAERDLHLDLVLQREVLELLLCYNTLWLRIGMEVIYQEEIVLRSNADAYGLSAFIVSRFFNDYSKTKKTNLYSAQYKDSIKKFTLKKFFALVLFLDTAKKEKLIKQDPCLFKRTAAYKETKDILARFSSQIISGVGDICRFLKRLGYEVTHKQTYIDEYDYAFKNLAVDLRDGVRLTRVMEIISLRSDLTCQLRAPAISRLQKIHNCALGLKALSEGDYNIVGDINERDIADGHREKTLSLIWQIIYKFRAPRFNNAATKIATWWRNNFLKVVIDRRIRERRSARFNAAATRIQKSWRAYITRKRFGIMKKEHIFATIVLQKYVRGWITRKNFQRFHSGAVSIQRWYRNIKICSEVQHQYRMKKIAAIRIQEWYRTRVLSRKLESAAAVIKNIIIEAKLRYDKAIIIQRTFKSIVIHRKFHQIIEGMIRYNRQRTLYIKQVVYVQSIYRMIQCRSEYVRRRNAIIHIQRKWRNYMVMKCELVKFQQLKKSAVLIQQRFRATLQMREERTKYLCLAKSAKTIQTKWRATLQMRKEQSEYLVQRNAVRVIQPRWKATLLMRTERLKYQEVLKTVKFLQDKVRANIMMKNDRSTYVQLKSAAVILQQRYRAKLVMRKSQSEYCRIRYSVIFIQRKFRAKLKMKEEQIKYQKVITSVTSIQLIWRATLVMRTERANYLKLKTAAVVLQKRYRAKLEMERTQAEYHKIMSSVITIQRKLRATLKMRREHDNYQNIIKSVAAIQIKWRATLLMRKVRADYLAKKEACGTIQRRWRATMLMKTEHAGYRKLLSSVKVIQNRVRANMLMKREHGSFLQMKKAAIVFQQRHRANLEMRKAQEVYRIQRKQIITIQQRFRATMKMQEERNKYLKLLQAVRRIQLKWRATLQMRREMKAFIMRKQAVLAFQKRWRDTVLMRVERKQYLQIRDAAIKIQQEYKANRQMRIEKQRYQLIRNSVIKIQLKWRAHLLMKKQRLDYLQMRAASLVIQRRYRAEATMRISRNRYNQLKYGILTVQSHIRGFISRQRFKEMLTPEYREQHTRQRAALKIQATWRGYYHRKTKQSRYTIISPN